MGTPELAKLGLEAIIESSFFNVSLIISQEDKKLGRGLNVVKTPVKIFAEKHKIKILQPQKIKEITENIKKENPELIVVIAYGKIIPKEILDIPKYGCINVHGSLLPKYRGSSCIQATILNGDKTGGITIMKMDEQMDTGDIIKKLSINLDKKETSQSLMDKIKTLTQKNLSEVLINYINNKIKTEAQDNSKASYVKMIKKEDGLLSLTEKAELIERKIRAYYPWPGTYFFIEKTENNNLPKKKLLFKILEVSEIIKNPKNIKMGNFFNYQNKLAISCSDKAIVLKKVQLEGKKPIISNEFLKGNSWILNTVPSSNG